MRKIIGCTEDSHRYVIFDEADQKIYITRTDIRIFGVKDLSDAIATAKKNLKSFIAFE